MIDFKKHLESLKRNNVNINKREIDFKHSFGDITECRKLIRDGFKYLEPEINFEWLPEYESIAEYLSDTNNKGLSFIGNSGRGKTLFLTKLFPILMASKKRISYFNNGNSKNESTWVFRVFNAKEEWGKFSLRIIDEVGRERQPIKGEIELFPAFVDWCEVNNHPLFFCSNMTGKQFEERYGTWTVDRIKKLSKIVIFDGQSLRK